MNVDQAIQTLRANGFDITWLVEGGTESIKVKMNKTGLLPAAYNALLKLIKDQKPAALEALRVEAAPKLMRILAANAAGTHPISEAAEVQVIALLNIATGRPVADDGTVWADVIRAYDEAARLAA